MDMGTSTYCLEAHQPIAPAVDVSASGATDRTRLLSNCRLAARVAGLGSVCVGVVVLLGGWAFDIPSLRTAVPGYSAMVPNTALGLLLCGVSLSLDRGS